MKLEVGSRSDKGLAREFNEDAMGVYRPADAQERARKGELFLVADGMGGHQGGEVASNLAVKTILRSYSTWTGVDVGAELVAALQQANAEIYGRSGGQGGLARMGTTCVGALLRGSELHIANVGDSRAYRVRNGQLEQLSRDHSLVADQIAKGVIDAEQARHLAYRSTITRALGQKPAVEVDYFLHTLQVGDAILLCTDGLSGQVQDAEIAAAVLRYPPEEAATRLVNLANQRGGPDNVSVIIVRVVPDTPKSATPLPRPVAQPGWKKYLRFWPVAVVAVAAMLLAAVVLVAVLIEKDRTAAPMVTPSPTSKKPAAPPPPTQQRPSTASTPAVPNVAPAVGPIVIELEVPADPQKYDRLARELGYADAADMLKQNPPSLLPPSPPQPPTSASRVSLRQPAMLIVGQVTKSQGQKCEFQVTMGGQAYQVTCSANVIARDGDFFRVLGLMGQANNLQAVVIDVYRPQQGGSSGDWANWYKDPNVGRGLWAYTVASNHTVMDPSTQEGERVLVYAQWEADRAQTSNIIRLLRQNGDHYTLVR